MTLVSPLVLTLIVVGVIPFGWSGILAAAHSIARFRLATERSEQVVLALMIAPILAGLGLIATVLFAPEAASTLPPIVRITLQPAAPVVEQAQVALAPVFDWAALLAWAVALLYLVGAVWLFARFVRARLRLRHILKNTVDAESAWGKGVAITDGDVPPFASGGTRIVLPRSLILHLSPDQVAMVVRHERAHLDRRDPALFIGLAMIEIALWFNPVIRRQAERCRLAAELACDRIALKSAPSMQAAYAKSLVLALKHGVGDAMYCASAIPSDTMGDYEMRISEIMRPAGSTGRRPARASFIATLLLGAPVIVLQTTLAGAAIPARPVAPLAVAVDHVRTGVQIVAQIVASPKPGTVAPAARINAVPVSAAIPAMAPTIAAMALTPVATQADAPAAPSGIVIYTASTDARQSSMFNVCVSRFDRMVAGEGLTEANAYLVESQCLKASNESPPRCDAFLTGASRAGVMAVALIRSRRTEVETGQYLAAVGAAQAGRQACGF